MAACGDDDAATTTVAPTTGETTAPTGATTASTAASVTTSATATSAGSVDNGPAVADLLARYEVTPLRITYLLGEDENDDPAIDTRDEIIIAQDPTANPPVESIIMPEADSMIIISDGITIFCDGGNNMCFEVPGGTGDSLAAGFLGPFASGVLAAGQDGSILGAALTEDPITVAGRNGVCFTYQPPAGADATFVRQCIDSELGFTLLLEAGDPVADTVELVMELIDFSQPTAADFEPTGPVTATP